MSRLPALTFTMLAFGLVACAPDPGEARQGSDAAARRTGTAAAASQECAPIETRPPNAAGQEPAFRHQTRTCAVDSQVAHELTVIADGLEHPWAVEPLPDGRFLVTERPGRMRVVSADGTLGRPIQGIPAVSARRQGGLLDVVLGPDFATDRMIYWSYAEPRSGGNGTSVARGVLSEDGTRVSDVEVLLRTRPTYDGGHHFGSRLVFDAEGHLFVTLGERSDRPIRDQAQELDSHLGKVLRILPDGSVPEGNPFADREGAYPEIWTYGHRNVQAATIDPEGRIWTVEHGPRGGDELNLLEPGVNYGWPVMSYGVQYSGRPIPNSRTQRQGMRQPVYYWDPVIAPSGAQWYTGDAFPAWQGSLFVGSMVQERLVRLVVSEEAEGWRVTGEEHLLTDRGQRVRDVRQGPDGALYLVTDEDDGELWRVAPPE